MQRLTFPAINALGKTIRAHPIAVAWYFSSSLTEYSQARQSRKLTPSWLYLPSDQQEKARAAPGSQGLASIWAATAKTGQWMTRGCRPSPLATTTPRTEWRGRRRQQRVCSRWRFVSFFRPWGSVLFSFLV
jgi:hypothetical protein